MRAKDEAPKRRKEALNDAIGLDDSLAMAQAP
jgi:hypothetical protein